MPELTVVETTISPLLDGGSPKLSGVLCRPEGEGPWPGVVIVHEAFGVTDVMRRQVQRMAEAGYIVLMPDLFVAGGARKCLSATFRALMSGKGRAWVDIESARQMLAARDDCTGAIGVLGFCMGGGFALGAATRGFAAASANYGRLPKELDEALAGACPIVGSYGGRDSSLKGAAAKLEAELTKLDVPHDVKEYPQAGHSFLNEEESGSMAFRFVMKRFLHLGPNPEAAADAWQRIDGFFAEHLAASATSSTPA